MLSRLLVSVAALALVGIGAVMVTPRATASPVVMMIAGPTQLGGVIADPGLTVFDSLSRSPDFSIFTATLADADLSDTLTGGGDYTVFAVPDDVFHKLPPGEADKLSKPDNKSELVKFAGYHVIKGRLDSRQIFAAIAASSDEKALFRTLQGENLTFTRNGQVLQIVDASDKLIDITVADVPQANGLIYVIDHPLTPK